MPKHIWTASGTTYSTRKIKMATPPKKGMDVTSVSKVHVSETKKHLKTKAKKVVQKALKK